MKVLLVKMSSMGDIVHALPAVDDAARRGVRFDWIVEEDYRALAARARGVDEVLPVAFRRWRHAPADGIKELLAVRRGLRARHYDVVLDAQGLIKSAIVAGWAGVGERVGFDASSARERLAALGNQRRVHVPGSDHAISRLRRLFAAALGYEFPDTEPVFNLGPPSTDVYAPDNAILLAHGTTWKTKLWPEGYWTDVARRAAAAGYTPVLPWMDGERARAERVAAAVPEAWVCPSMDLADVLGLVENTRGVIGVDSGLVHFGAALGRPTVMLFGPTDHRLTGCHGPQARDLSAGLPCSPCRSRVCRRPDSARVSNGAAACLAAVAPDEAWTTLAAMMGRDGRVATVVK